LNIVDQTLGSSRWGGWQIYVTATSSLMATLGVVFGVLDPLTKWFDGSKAVLWTAVCLVGIGIVFVAVHRRMKQSGRVQFKSYAVKFTAVALVWAVFPYALCTVAKLSGNITVECTCRKVPPNVSIEIQKYGSIVRVTDSGSLEEVLRRTKAIAPVTPTFRHPVEIETILRAMRAASASSYAREFVAHWDQEEKMVATTLLRLIAAFSSSPLAASELSKAYQERMLFQVRGSQQFAVLTGDQALDYLNALRESSITYQPSVDEEVVKASERYLQVAMLNHYASLQNVPAQYTSGVDPDFLTFLHNLPSSDHERVRSVAYPEFKGELSEFECGSPARGAREASHSRFVVPPSEVTVPSVLEQLHTGPWPLGPPSTYFSDGWWLDHAIWQMLARESGGWRDNLAMRVAEYDQCGPP